MSKWSGHQVRGPSFGFVIDSFNIEKTALCYLFFRMDKFVTILPAKRRASGDLAIPLKREQVQLQITDLRKVSSVDAIARHAASLRQAVENSSPATVILPVLEQLTTHYISIDILETTGIGQLVFRLSRNEHAVVARVAGSLYEVWRKDAKEALQRQQKQQRRKSLTPSSRPGSDQGLQAATGSKAAFILQDVSIENEMMEWDRLCVAGARLRRPEVGPAAAGAADDGGAAPAAAAPPAAGVDAAPGGEALKS